MRKTPATVWVILIFFFVVMGGVVFISFSRPSQQCNIDPADIVGIRRMTSRTTLK